MQAQDQRNLVNKIITMRPTFDNDEPKRYKHLSRHFEISKNEKQRVIDLENNKLLSKIMHVMARKTKTS